jgi:hypothetical protein
MLLLLTRGCEHTGTNAKHSQCFVAIKLHDIDQQIKSSSAHAFGLYQQRSWYNGVWRRKAVAISTFSQVLDK